MKILPIPVETVLYARFIIVQFPVWWILGSSTHFGLDDRRNVFRIWSHTKDKTRWRFKFANHPKLSEGCDVGRIQALWSFTLFSLHVDSGETL